jgi:hypothetical protein
MHAAGTLVRTAAASCGSAAHLHYGHLSNDGLIEYINPSHGAPSHRRNSFFY